MKTFFIHIGIHKTGTTFLQRKIFPQINSICEDTRYLGSFYLEKKNKRVIDEYHKCFNFFAFKKFKSEDLKKLFVENNLSNQNLFYSNENILRPFDKSILLYNLSILRKFFNIKLIVTTRNITKLIISRFNQNQSFGKKKINQDVKKAICLDDCYSPHCNWLPFKNLYLCKCFYKGIKIINPIIYKKDYLKKAFNDFDISFFEIINDNDSLNYNEIKKLFNCLGIENAGAIEKFNYDFPKVNPGKKIKNKQELENLIKEKLNSLNI